MHPGSIRVYKQAKVLAALNIDHFRRPVRQALQQQTSLWMRRALAVRCSRSSASRRKSYSSFLLLRFAVPNAPIWYDCAQETVFKGARAIGVVCNFVNGKTSKECRLPE